MSGIEPVQKQFGRTAAAYVESATHARGEDLDRIVALATENGGERIVDVGTGVGQRAELPTSFGPTCFGDLTLAADSVASGAGGINIGRDGCERSGLIEFACGICREARTL